MAYDHKFEISGLKRKSSFEASLQPVLAHYCLRVQKRAKKYLAKPTEKNLHALRIALRQFRYLLEVYFPLIKRGHFRKIFTMTVNLQNLLGERRDLDVMQLQLTNIYDATATPLPVPVMTELQTMKARFDRQIADQLPQFIANKHIKKFTEE